MDQTVLIHEKQGIAFITLNRPDFLNAMDLGVLERLGDRQVEIYPGLIFPTSMI